MTWVNLVVAWSDRFGLLRLFAGGFGLQVAGSGLQVFVQNTSRKFSYGLLVCMLFCCCMQGVKLQLLVVFIWGSGLGG